MSALAHFIERAGVATITISLIREQTERVNPPRSLWVPFPLGRPLGTAGDAAFQTDVLKAAFDLLETATEPTIVDFPHDAPGEVGPEQWACPLNLAVATDDSLGGRFQAEIDSLRPWFDVTVERRGRTAFGVTGASIDELDQVAVALLGLAETASFAELPEGAEWAFDMPLLARHLASDMRMFYQEALAAQPGNGAPTHDAINQWIFGTTVLGEVLQLAANRALESDDGATRLIKFLMIPEGHH